MRHYAVIPVKHQSDRLDGKNFRPFVEGKSLLDLKVEQLQRSGVYSEIFISSDSPLARESARVHGVNFLERPPRFCNNAIPWSEVIVQVVSSVAMAEDDALSWCHVTSPLFADFASAARRFEALPREYNGLFAVARLNRFILDTGFRPVNYSWGPAHPYSQDLRPYYFVTGALFIGKKRDLLDARYVITSNPYPLEVSEREAIDIDTELDFELARWLLKKGEGP
jgi:CMP-N-acetylneuraminic acid synthetase